MNFNDDVKSHTDAALGSGAISFGLSGVVSLGVSSSSFSASTFNNFRKYLSENPDRKAIRK